MTELERKLKENILDLKYIYDEKNLNNAISVLEELLEKEKKDFQKKLDMKDEAITFDSLEDFSVLDTYFSLLEHLNGVKWEQKLRDIIEAFEPKYIDFWNEIAYSKRYFDILVYCLEKTEVNAEQRRILERSIEYYKERWIDLPLEKQERLKEINKEISELQQKFSNNVLDSELAFSFFFEDDILIEEMPDDDKNIAKKRAEEKGKKGYFFDLSYSSYPLVLTYCTDSEIRKYFYIEKNKVASEWKYDNREIIRNIHALKEEKAHILWHKNYAEYSLSLKMAKKPEKVEKLMKDIYKKARIKAEQEKNMLQDYFKVSQINPWDTAFYFRKYKKEKYNFEEKVLKQYFEFESVLSWLFHIVKDLYDVDIVEVKGISPFRYFDNVRVYEVKRDWVLLSYFVGDYFYREWKRGWAWANNLRPKYEEDNGEKIVPFVVNVCSFQENKEGKTLLSRSDVETLFHEFGHALHEMLSKSKYSELSWFWVEWDFVELPSQIMENWCKEKESLSRFAFNCETGETIPEDIFRTMKEIENIGSGHHLLRQLEFSMLDMMLYTHDTFVSVEEMDSFILETINSLTLYPKESTYRMYTSFHHIFDGGYSAGYYSYMWAEIIESQVFGEFLKTSLFSKEIAKRFYETILSAWSSKKSEELFYDFAKTDVNVDEFLKRYDIKK